MQLTKTITLTRDDLVELMTLAANEGAYGGHVGDPPKQSALTALMDAGLIHSFWSDQDEDLGYGIHWKD